MGCLYQVAPRRFGGAQHGRETQHRPVTLRLWARKLFRTFTKTVRGLSPGTRPRAIRPRAGYVAVLRFRVPGSIRAPKAYLFAMASHLVHRYRDRCRACPPHVALDQVPLEILHLAQPAEDASSPESAVALLQRWCALTERLAGSTGRRNVRAQCSCGCAKS